MCCASRTRTSSRCRRRTTARAVESLGARSDMEVVYGEANSEFAVAWLSRLPVARAENHRLPSSRRRCSRSRWTARGCSRRISPPDARGPTSLGGSPRSRRSSGVGGDVRARRRLQRGPSRRRGRRPPPRSRRLDYVSRRPVELVLDAGFTDCFRALNPSDAAGRTSPGTRGRDSTTSSRAELRAHARSSRPRASDHFALVAELD